VTTMLTLFTILLSMAAAQSDDRPSSCPDEGTMTDMLGPFYIENAPETTTIAPLEQLSVPSNVLYVEGTVYGEDCIPMSNIRVEPWYAGGEDGGYSSEDSDLEWRGVLYTDECGRYNYSQTFPEIYAGRPLHVHFRVSDTETNQEHLITQMYFEGYDSNVPRMRSLQIVPITTLNEGSKSVVFNIYLSDIKGTAKSDVCNLTEITTALTEETYSPSNLPSIFLAPAASTTITATQTPSAITLKEVNNSTSNLPSIETPSSSGVGLHDTAFKLLPLSLQILVKALFGLVFL